MAYKIQGLDSDSFVSAKQKAQSKNKNGSQNNNGGKQPTGAIIDVLSSSLDELQRHVQAEPHEEVKLTSQKKHRSKESLEDILAQIASLTNKLQQLESKFQAGTNSISTKIGKAAIHSAQNAAVKLEAAIKKEASEKNKMGILKDCMVGLGAIISVSLCCCGAPEAGFMCGILTAAIAAGVTSDLKDYVAKVAVGVGASTEAANAIGSGVVCLTEVALTVGVSAGVSACTTAAAATESSVNAVVQTAVKSAVKEAVESSVSTALKSGTDLVSDNMQTIIKTVAKKAAKDLMTKFAEDGLGSNLVNKAGKDAISQGIKAGVRSGVEASGKQVANFVEEFAYDVSKAASQATESIENKLGKTIIKTALKTMMKNVSSEVTTEIGEDMGEVASKELQDLPEKLANDLKQASKDIKWKRFKASIVMAFANSTTSSGLIQNLCSALGHLIPSKKGQKDFEIISEVLLTLAALVATIMSGSSMTEGGSNTGNVLKDATNVAKKEANIVSRMLSKIMSNPAKLMSYTQVSTSAAQAGVDGAMAMAQVKMSEIEDQMAMLKPMMSESDASAKIQQDLQTQSQQLFADLYKAIPTLMADANSISAIFATAAQAIAS